MNDLRSTLRDAVKGHASWFEALLELCNTFDTTHGVLLSVNAAGDTRFVTRTGFSGAEPSLMPDMLRLMPSDGITAGNADDSPMAEPEAIRFGLGPWVQATCGFGVVTLFRPAGGDDFDAMDLVALARAARMMEGTDRPVGSRMPLNAVALAGAVMLGVFGSHEALAMPADTVTLTLEGRVEAACAIDLGGAGDRIALDALSSNRPSSTAGLAFTLDCNAPFEYTLESGNGALTNDGGRIAAGSDTIETTLPYTVRFRADLQDGDTDAIDQTCTSASIDDALPDGSSDRCAFADSGTSVAIGKAASLTVSVDSAGRVLLGGTYTDSLKLTVSVRP